MMKIKDQIQKLNGSVPVPVPAPLTSEEYENWYHDGRDEGKQKRNIFKKLNPFPHRIYSIRSMLPFAIIFYVAICIYSGIEINRMKRLDNVRNTPEIIYNHDNRYKSKNYSEENNEYFYPWIDSCQNRDSTDDNSIKSKNGSPNGLLRLDSKCKTIPSLAL